MNSRCDECGSPVRSNHDGNIVCTRDESHGRGVAFGGAGSGWSAAGGHVPGSQKGHAAAARAHETAANSHEQAAHQIETLGRKESMVVEHGQGRMSKESVAGVRQEASTDTKSALAASKTVGSHNAFQAQAATTYDKMAREAKSPADQVKFHRQAAQAHIGMAHAHSVFAGEKK